MDRKQALERLAGEPVWDILIIGGGATGLGCAVDAASRGYSVCLVEQADFAKGTSSRSTKLVHGGVRYLKQGNISLVLEALKERGRLCQNAPHLVRHQAFIVPVYSWWEGPFYGIGMKVYDALAGRLGLEPSKFLSKRETMARIPTLEEKDLTGGVVYYDGQFDDARLAVNLAQTVSDLGGVAVNYVRVSGLIRENDVIRGVRAVDEEAGSEYEIRAKCVINATGVFCDTIRRMDDPADKPMITASQGVHLVLPKHFVPGDAAIMVPQTTDGRVLFAVPWHGRVVVGTTDTLRPEASLEPQALEEEIDFILENAARYMHRAPTRKDVLSVYAGLRPLVSHGNGGSTAALSRDHTIVISPSGLLTITGGKWTTYRRMAEDAIDHAETVAGLEGRPCRTHGLAVHGSTSEPTPDGPPLIELYGSDAPGVMALAEENPEWKDLLHPNLPLTGAEVVWAAREEMARTVEDVLSRRSRSLLLDAQAASEVAPRVAALLARELGHDEAWAHASSQAFQALATQYQVKA